MVMGWQIVLGGKYAAQRDDAPEVSLADVPVREYKENADWYYPT